ncbi:protein GAMETE EXPRESSED 2 isoform X2 [Diospyros lotus]|uniref:protein GAMETE EXPRESSED 2 isoform X2 n=1 Tax=Diospyros lotus TaxID=55363 RepID=UPI002252C6AB|nr:protein GAMETE EXPRESSED 2 isoform X2 [Diospyros lotus]
MASQILLCTLISLLPMSLSSPVGPKLVNSENVSIPSFAFGWSDEKDTFAAGDIATIKVKILGNYERDKYKYTFHPNITVNGKMGNSSLVSGVSLNFDGELSDWRISFVPIKVGLFNVLVTDEHFNVLDSSLHFQVTPGKIYPAACVVSWMGQMDELVSGTKATVVILPKDAFGNTITSPSEELSALNFMVSASYVNGSSANVLNITHMGWDKVGYYSIGLTAASAGNLLLHVEEKNQSLNGSPLPFKVNPGALDVSNCEAHWDIDTKLFQLFSKMEFFIHQRDQYGNFVPGFYQFDVEVIEKGTNLFMPVADLSSREIVPGIQVSSFSLEEPGDFMLLISDKDQSKAISNMPYNFTVFIGYCDGVNSIISGSGLNDSVAGEVGRFSVLLKDAYQYPAPIDLEKLQVRIVHEFDSHFVQPRIYPVQNVNGSRSSRELNYSVLTGLETASAPSVGPVNNSTEHRKSWASSFDIIYTAEKSGIYEITVFCGNIALNGGQPFRKEVTAGEVNASLSGVVQYAPKVPKMIKNEIVVQLMDSFSNPILFQESKLNLEMASINKSRFSTSKFVNDTDGLYIGSYLAEEIGTYEICASFDGNRFLPCPFGVNVYSSEYFPKAFDDSISVSEDESIAFDALENDYFAGGNASILEFSKPGHGSLLQYGWLFRYTPYEGFAGNDSFSYTISDANSNFASGAVNISVLGIPPQFISFPSQLQATEDILSPRFGGFPGIEIIYSDLMENISVSLIACSGALFLSPMLMQVWQPIWSELSVSRGEGKAKDLILQGRLEVINFALQSIQYLGNENFYGNETIHVSTKNKNGVSNLDIPLLVEPINDPPFINVPEFILFEKKNNEGHLIFDRQRHRRDFLIGDPDLLNFPALGSAVVIESILVFSLGVLLLYFTCKCAIVLVNEKRSHMAWEIELPKVERSSSRNSNPDLSENVTHFTGCCSSTMLKNQPSTFFCQRSRDQSGNGNCSKDELRSSQSSSDHHQETQTPVLGLMPLASEKKAQS